MKPIYFEVLAQCLFEYGRLPEDADGNARPEISEHDWLNVIERVEQEIAIYCNLRTVPRDLRYTWASMCVDYMRYWLAASGSTDGDQGQTPEQAQEAMIAESIKVGDADVKYSNRTLAVDDTGGRARVMALGSHQPDLDDIIMNYREQLNKFRRMTWGPRR